MAGHLEQRTVATLRAFWRARMGKLTVVLLVIALWAPVVLVLPGLYWGGRGLRLLMHRLLYSVRAKLVAFYLYAAFLPILLVLTVLLFVGYVVLGQVSARVVQGRLEQLGAWADERARLLETVYWQGRAAGVAPSEAVARALDAAYPDVSEAGFGAWALLDGQVAERRGATLGVDPRPPGWLGERRFVGLAVGDSTQLELRTRLRFVEPGGVVEVGSLVPIRTRLLNSGLAGDSLALRAGIGSPDRLVHGRQALSDSTVAREGIFATIPVGGNVTVSPTTIRYSGPGEAPQRPDSARTRFRFSSGSLQRGPVLADSSRESPLAEYSAASLAIRSRYRLLNWLYVGYPLRWSDGSTGEAGPPIVIAFSVEGATRALLRTGIGVLPPLLVGVGVVLGFLLLLQIIATLRGYLYARAISDSVAKLDRGVRAIQAGDFDYRIKPRERDQLGSLALAFNDMSQRLQGLLDERAAHQAVERELGIAREVQKRLFPEHMPYAPFFEAGGVCVPARTVSGDYYDFIEVAGGYDAVVADVSGKGMSAALLMASVHAALHSLYLRDGRGAPDPAEVVTRLNQHLHQYSEPTRFVTLFLVRYCGDGRLVYCNAGHNPAALVRAGRVEWLSSGGLVLGPFADLVYEASVVAVQPGDVVCLYSDGVTEAASPIGEHFGEDRLAEALRGHAAEHPRDVVGAVQEAVRRWRGEAEISDDVTLVVLRITA